MIDIAMYAALGFLLASLLALLLAPPLWNRAVRLTSRRIEATMPMSVADIQADKDQLRAEFAIELRRLEVALEKAKDKATRELVEANKRRVKIAELNAEIEAAKASQQENVNATRVMEQTIRRKLPDLESRLKTAKETIAELEQANAELRNTLSSQSEALKTARGAVQTQRNDIAELRAALEGTGGGLLGRVTKSGGPKDVERLTAELSRVKEELERNKIGREENEHLRQEINKLASNILAASRTQSAPAPKREIRNVAETVASLSRKPELEPMPHNGNGATDADPSTMRTPLTAHPADSLAKEPEPLLAARDDLKIETAATDEPAPEEPEVPAKGLLAKRLAARRAKRDARKATGQSLSERLKGIPAESPET